MNTSSREIRVQSVPLSSTVSFPLSSNVVNYTGEVSPWHKGSFVSEIYPPNNRFIKWARKTLPPAAFLVVRCFSISKDVHGTANNFPLEQTTGWKKLGNATEEEGRRESSNRYRLEYLEDIIILEEEEEELALNIYA